MSWKVEYYINRRGESPVKEFLLGLDSRTQQKVMDSIDILAQSGPFLKPPYMKKLDKCLYELKLCCCQSVIFTNHWDLLFNSCIC